MINKFLSPKFIEEVILDGSDKVIGTLRLKPSSILWKPKGQKSYFSVNLDKFDEWMRNPSTKAKKADH